MNQEIFLCTNVITVEEIDEMSNLENVVFKDKSKLSEYIKSEFESSNYFDESDEDNGPVYFDDDRNDIAITENSLAELLNSTDKIEIYAKYNASNYDEYVLLFIIEKFSI